MFSPDALPWWLGLIFMMGVPIHWAYILCFAWETFGLIGLKGGEIGRQLRMELWWLEIHVAFPAMLLYWYLTANSPIDWFFCAVNTIIWRLWAKHDHDDRWKKRRKRLAAKIKEIGGKLVVVPEPIPVGTS